MLAQSLIFRALLGGDPGAADAEHETSPPALTPGLLAFMTVPQDWPNDRDTHHQRLPSAWHNATNERADRVSHRMSVLTMFFWNSAWSVQKIALVTASAALLVPSPPLVACFSTLYSQA